MFVQEKGCSKVGVTRVVKCTEKPCSYVVHLGHFLVHSPVSHEVDWKSTLMQFMTDSMSQKHKNLHLCHWCWGPPYRTYPLPNGPMLINGQGCLQLQNHNTLKIDHSEMTRLKQRGGEFSNFLSYSHIVKDCIKAVGKTHFC